MPSPLHGFHLITTYHMVIWGNGHSSSWTGMLPAAASKGVTFQLPDRQATYFHLKSLSIVNKIILHLPSIFCFVFKKLHID